MRKEFDVIIVGGGIAGLYLAQLLAEKKNKVCVLEAKKDPLNFSFYTLGSFLDVEKYGFTKNIIASHVTKGHFLSRHLHIKGRSWSHCYVLDKTKIHEELIAKCNSLGVDILTDAPIKSSILDEHGNMTSVKTKNGEEFKGKLFIDCSGRTGILTRKVGLMPKKDNEAAVGLEYNVKYKKSSNEAYLFYSTLFKSGYGWIFPLKEGRAIVGYGTFEKGGKISMKKYFDDLLQKKPLVDLVEKDNDDCHGGVFPVTPVITKFIKGNVIGVGDSVSQGSPLLGEGYRFIIEAALLAAPAISTYLASNNIEDLKQYEINWNTKYAKLFYRHKKLQRIALKGVQNEFVADFLTFMLMTKRSVTFERLIAGETSKRNLLLP